MSAAMNLNRGFRKVFFFFVIWTKFANNMGQGDIYLDNC